MTTWARLSLLFGLLAAFWPAVGRTATPIPIEVPIGGTRVIRVGTPVATVSIVSRTIADVIANPPDEIIITGRNVGKTELTAVDRSGVSHVYNVRVTSTGDTLRDKLNALFPNQRIDVQIVGQSVILSGVVNDVSLVEKIEKVVVAYTGLQGEREGNLRVANLIQVRGTPQVQLEVRFAEVLRTAMRKIGFNFWVKNTGDSPVIGGLLGANTPIGPTVSPKLGSDRENELLQLPGQLPALTSPLAGAFNFLFSNNSASQLPLTATLSILSQRGFAKSLAEPTLVAISGQEATFLAGGEFPVPTAGGLGTQSAQFKRYGIQLSFTPFVLGDDAIELRLQTTVSELDYSVAQVVAGINVPGLTTRDSSTTVRLRNGQSFAIAGLLSDRMNSVVNKVPGLGDLPILGALFRSLEFQRRESELLLVVTARLANPIGEGERIRLTGEDEMSDPSDLELFLLGIEESHSPAPAGKVGFIR